MISKALLNSFYLRSSPLFLTSPNLFLTRNFSTYAQLKGSSILLSRSKHPKIRIPYKDDQYDFTLRSNETVKELEERIKEVLPGIGPVQILNDNNERVEEQKVETLMSKKFQIDINRSKYDVYPNLEHMVALPSKGNQEMIEKILQQRSIPIARRVIVQHFIDILLNLIDKDNAKIENISEEKMNSYIEDALKQYTEVYNKKILSNSMEQLEKAKIDLEKVNQDWDDIQNRAERHANARLWQGFSFAAAQLIGMGACIFSIYGWEEMEPITYLVSTFYLTVGTGYYLFLKGDFEYTNAYGLFKNRKEKKLIKQLKFDTEKQEFLEKYVKTLEEQIKTLKHK